MKPSYVKLPNRMDRSPWVNLAEILSTYTNSSHIYKLFKFLFMYSLVVEDREKREGRVFIDQRPLAASLLLYPLPYRVFISMLISRYEYLQAQEYLGYTHLKGRLSYNQWDPIYLINLTCGIRGEHLNQRFVNLLSLEYDNSLSNSNLEFLMNALRIDKSMVPYILPEAIDINRFPYQVKQLSEFIPILEIIDEDTFFSLMNKNDRYAATRLIISILELPYSLYEKLVTFNRKVLKRIYINNLY